MMAEFDQFPGHRLKDEGVSTPSVLGQMEGKKTERKCHSVCSTLPADSKSCCLQIRKLLPLCSIFFTIMWFKGYEHVEVQSVVFMKAL